MGAGSGDHPARLTAVPDATALFAAFPESALETGTPGRATIRCQIGDRGVLSGCAVVDENPRGYGFGPAALRLSASMTASLPVQDGAESKNATITIPLAFDLPPVTAPRIYETLPTGEQLMQAYPNAARVALIHGRAKLYCLVTAEGQSYGCHVLSEYPAGYGFGKAALRLAPFFKMKAVTESAESNDSSMVVPIVFNIDGVARDGYPFTGIELWRATPSRNDIEAAFPVDARTMHASGLVELACAVSADGRLESCDIAREVPEGLGFGKAAITLAPKFLADFPPGQVKGPGQTVLTTIRFRASPETTPVTFWRRQLNLPALTDDDLERALPEPARRAKVRSAHVVVSCSVGSDGSMHDCSSTEEAPANLGVGEAAVKLVSGRRIDVWKDGASLEGRPFIWDIVLGRPPR